jgi:hypothetical protein
MELADNGSDARRKTLALERLDRMTRYRALLIALVLGCGPAIGWSAEPATVLAEVARALADSRASPARSAAARCPANAGVLAGLPVGQVLIELGQPNVENADASAITYLFASEPNRAARGGGFPELTFRFDRQGKISSVECRHAK